MLLVVLVVGVVVLLYNPGLIKGPLERYLGNLAGYPISLQGELTVDTGRLTKLTATNISVSGPDWASRHDLVSVAHLKLTLDTSSLFKDIIVIDSLRVEDLQVSLESDKEGIGNWITSHKQPPNDGTDGRDRVVIFNSVQLTNSRLTYLNGKKGVEQVLHIATLDQQQQSDGMLKISLDGDFNTRPVEFNGSVGPYASILQGQNIAFIGAGSLGDLNIEGKGLIDDLLKPRRPQFNLKIQGPDIDEITAMFGADDLGSGGFSLRTHGEEVNDHFEADLNGKIGDIMLGASIQTTDLSKLDELDLKPEL